MGSLCNYREDKVVVVHVYVKKASYVPAADYGGLNLSDPYVQVRLVEKT